MPAWHTAALIALILLVAVVGLSLDAGSGDRAPTARGSGAVVAYAPAIVVQWGLLLYVCRVGRPCSALKALLGRGWARASDVVLDLVLALPVWLLIEAVEAFAAREGPSIPSALHAGRTEAALAGVLALSAGFCEEVVYRGYLRVQLTALTHGAALGVVLQAALFGIAHLDQGPARACRVAAYGLLLGILAAWRGSLAPAIVCHVCVDLSAAFS